MELSQRIAAANKHRNGNSAGEDPFADVRDRVHASIIDELGPQLADGDAVEQDELRELVRTEIRNRLAQEKELSLADRQRLVDDILDDTLGHGPLERLLADDTVTEIMVNSPRDVWIERNGK